MFKLELIPMTIHEQRTHERAVERGKSYRRSEADLLLPIMEVERTRLFEKLRLQSTRAYCIRYMGLTEAVAEFSVTVARKCVSVPQLKQALLNCELTMSMAAQICSVITSENHAEWIDKAKRMTKRQLEREVAITRPGTQKPTSYKAIAENCTRVSLDASDDFLRLLERVADLESSRCSKNVSEPEAIEAALRLYVESNDPIEKAKRAAKRFQNSSREEPVKHKVNRRDEGRCQAILPDGTRCSAKRWVETHHVVKRSKGGDDSLENLITLCSAHHSQWHTYDDPDD